MYRLVHHAPQVLFDPEAINEMLAHEPGKVRREAGRSRWASKPPVARRHLSWCRSNTDLELHGACISGRRGLQAAPASPPCASVCAAAGISQVAGSACCPGGCEGAGGLLLLPCCHFRPAAVTCNGGAGGPGKNQQTCALNSSKLLRIPSKSAALQVVSFKPALPLHSLQAEEAQLHRMTKSLLDPSKILLKDKMAFVIGGCICICTSILPASAFARAAWWGTCCCGNAGAV